MSNVFEFVAECRNVVGTSAARKTRKEGGVPAVIYGGHQEPQMLTIDHNEIIKRLAHEAVFSHILDVNIEGKIEKAILKGVQRHPARPQILHLDFYRVDMTQLLKTHVPLHFINEQISVGGKKGGVVAHSMIDVEVSCLPADLPDYIEVDLMNLDIGDTFHLSDIVLPPRVEIVALSHGVDHNLPVASMQATK